VILVDTDILVWVTRGRQEAREWMRRTRQGGELLAISAVSITEIAGTMRSGERREVRRLLTSLAPLPVTMREAWQAAEFRRQYRRSHGLISVADYLIAATAFAEGLPLATLNVRHFPMFPGLEPPFVLSGT
jgi:predicted nucleic acid-binding protein